MLHKEMKTHLDIAVEAANRYLGDKPCDQGELLRALKYDCIAEEIAKQIEFMREFRPLF